MATDADAQAWIDDVVLDGGTVRDETAIDNFILKLKSEGIWAKLDHFLMRKYTGSSIGALKCLKTLTDGVNYGAVFNDDEGFKGDGIDDFIDTNLRFFTNFTQNSAHYLVGYKPGDGIKTDEVTGMGNCRILNDPANTPRYQINDSGQDVFLAQGSAVDGFLLANRSGATTKQFYRNGFEIYTDTTTSETPAAREFPSLAVNYTGNNANSSTTSNFVSGTEQYMSIGGSLTAGEALAFHNAIQDFYTEVETPAGTTISGITQKDGVTLVADGTYVQHLYADDNKGTNETLLEVGQTTGGEVTFTGELPVGKVRFIRIAYQDAGRDVVKEQFFSD